MAFGQRLLHEPSLQYRMMELHKGHGPEKFKIYQIAAGIALFLVVIGGLVVGLLAKAYRAKTSLRHHRRQRGICLVSVPDLTG